MKRTIDAAELNICFSEDLEKALFKWFVASFLMGKRIQADIACEAYRVIVENTTATPRASLLTALTESWSPCSGRHITCATTSQRRIDCLRCAPSSMTITRAR